MQLTIHHIIHLNREQRYALHDGQEVEAVGCSVPVWCEREGTTEPAREVFCRYILKNTKKDIPIKILEDGYEVTLPHRDARQIPLSNEDYWKMSEEQKEAYYRQMGVQASSKNLLDIPDGGSECLMYREHNKIRYNDTVVKVIHFVSINDLKHLHETAEYPTTEDNPVNS